MVNFKQHLKTLTIIYYIMVGLAIFPTLYFLAGSYIIDNYLSKDAIPILSLINYTITLIFSIWFLFSFYLGIFRGIFINKIIEDKTNYFYYKMAVFLAIGLFLLFFSIKQLIGLG